MQPKSKLTLTLKSAWISSSVKSNAALWLVRPALTTMPCKAPLSSIIWSTAEVIVASFVTSARTYLSLPGHLFCAAVNSSPGSA